MRINKKIVIKDKNDKVINIASFSTPLELISAFGCEFKTDEDLRVEEFNFVDDLGNTLTLWIEITACVLSLQLKVSGKQVLFLHDQFLESLEIEEGFNCIAIRTKETVLRLDVWPVLNLKITRDHIQDYDFPNAS